MKKLCVCLLLSSMTCAFQIASSSPQKSTHKADSIDTIRVHQQVQIDSIRKQIDSAKAAIQAEYISTLEKTNQQLSLWYNPYALMVGVLVILFTALAIIATAIVYRQSEEFKDRLDNFLGSYQRLFDKTILDLKARASAIDEEIRKNKDELEKATGESKRIVELELEKLAAQKSSVNSQIAATFASMPSGSFRRLSRGERMHECSNCHYSFIAQDQTPPGEEAKGRGLMCPNCGQVDKYL